jgi:hypothetical protein
MQLISGNRTVLWICRAALAFSWVYQGAVPKIACRSQGEIELLGHLIPVYQWVCSAIVWIGAAEIVFGLILLFTALSWVFLLNILALSGLTFYVLLFEREMFTLPFNPLTLNLSLIALSLIALIELKKQKPL